MLVVFRPQAIAATNVIQHGSVDSGASGWDNATLRIPIPNEHPQLTDPREFHVAVLPGDGTVIVWFPPHTMPVPHIIISVRGSGGCVVFRYRLCDLDWAPRHHLNLIPSPVTLPRPFVTAVESHLRSPIFRWKIIPMKRQRVMYLNAVSRSLRAPIVGFAIHEPIPSDAPQIEAGVEMPYETVHNAILDGWKVIHFPAQRAEGHPEAVGVFGYEFILDQIVDVDE